MLVLDFVVNGQKLDKAENTDLSYIVRGTDNSLCIMAKFDDEWKHTQKVINFYNEENNEWIELFNNGVATIPKRVLCGDIFSFSISGKNSEKLITTNRIYIKLREG